MRRRESSKPPPGSLLSNAIASSSSPIAMNLGGVNVKFDKMWKIEHSEFDKAAIEVEKVMNERDALIVNLHESLSQIKALRQEVIELNNTNKAALDLVSKKSNDYYNFIFERSYPITYHGS